MSTHTKTLSEMSTAEIKERANKEAVAYFRQQYEQNPNDQTKYEYEKACHQADQKPDPQMNRLASMSRAQIAAEWEAEGKKVEAQELDAWREQNANTWMANQQAYAATPENASKLIAEMERRQLRGSVADLEVCFDYLVRQGDIQPKPVAPAPFVLLTQEELQALPLNEMRSYIEECSQKGIL